MSLSWFGSSRIKSPGIDAGTLLAVARRRRRGRSQSTDDPSARVERIDNVVDFEVRRGVDRLAVAIHPVDHLVKELLAFGRLFDRGQFVAVAELYRPLESHASELTGRPRDREERRLETTPRHRLRTQSITLAKYDR